MARTVVINARMEAVEPRQPEVMPAQTDPAAASTESPPPTPEPGAQAAILTGQATSSLPIPEPAPPAVTATAEPAPPVSAAASHGPASRPAPTSVGPPVTSSLPSLPMGIDTTWYQARQVDVQAKAIGRVEPVYPLEAQRRNQEGTLKLMLRIDDLGRVLSVEVVEANPPGVFDEAALEAFRKARFQPAMKDGRPVRYQAYIRVDFKLED